MLWSQAAKQAMKEDQSDQRGTLIRFYVPPITQSFTSCIEHSFLGSGGGTGGVVPDPNDEGDD